MVIKALKKIHHLALEGAPRRMISEIAGSAVVVVGDPDLKKIRIEPQDVPLISAPNLLPHNGAEGVPQRDRAPDKLPPSLLVHLRNAIEQPENLETEILDEDVVTTIGGEKILETRVDPWYRR